MAVIYVDIYVDSFNPFKFKSWFHKIGKLGYRINGIEKEERKPDGDKATQTSLGIRRKSASVKKRQNVALFI